MKPYLCSLFILFSISANADPFTSGIEIGKLTEMIKTLNEGLEYSRKTLSIQEQLRDMEQNNLIKEISSGGEALLGLVNEIDETRDILDSFETPNEQIAQLKSDVSGYFALYKDASDEEDMIHSLRMYSNALRELDDQYWLGTESPNREKLYHFSRLVNDIERLQILKQSQNANTRALAEGLDSKEAALVTATDTNTMLAVLLDERQSQLAAEARREQFALEEEQVYNEFINYRGD